MPTNEDEPSRPPVRVRTRQRPAAPVQPPSGLSDSDQAASAYSVGYKKPPMHSRWRKGQSGNPRGPKKRQKSLNTIVREIMTAPISIRTGGRDQVMSRAQALVLKSVEAASKGNDRALDRLLRLYAVAMPDDGGGQTAIAGEQPLSPTDEATLEAFREMLAAEREGEGGQ